MAGPARTNSPSSLVITTGQQTTGSVNGTGGEADVTVTLDEAMADANYTAVASVVLDEDGESLRVRRVRTLSTTQVVVNVVNNAITSKTGTVHVIAVA